MEVVVPQIEVACSGATPAAVDNERKYIGMVAVIIIVKAEFATSYKIQLISCFDSLVFSINPLSGKRKVSLHLIILCLAGQGVNTYDKTVEFFYFNRYCFKISGYACHAPCIHCF